FCHSMRDVRRYAGVGSENEDRPEYTEHRSKVFFVVRLGCSSPLQEECREGEQVSPTRVRIGVGRERFPDVIEGNQKIRGSQRFAYLRFCLGRGRRRFASLVRESTRDGPLHRSFRVTRERKVVSFRTYQGYPSFFT